MGRVIGPLVRSEYPELHVSRFGVIPKNHQPGKWRLIVDLSHPEDTSINDGIEPELCSLHYTLADEAVQRLLAKEAGAMMVKMDIEGAYMIIPVNPHDRPSGPENDSVPFLHLPLEVTAFLLKWITSTPIEF